MSRSSSVSACSSSDRSSPMTGEVEASERPRPPGSGSLESYMFGRYCFSRDRTDWMFARTEWLVLTDCESGREKHVVGPAWGQKAARVSPWLPCPQRRAHLSWSACSGTEAGTKPAWRISGRVCDPDKNNMKKNELNHKFSWCETVFCTETTKNGLLHILFFFSTNAQLPQLWEGS